MQKLSTSAFKGIEDKYLTEWQQIPIEILAWIKLIKKRQFLRIHTVYL